MKFIDLLEGENSMRQFNSGYTRKDLILERISAVIMSLFLVWLAYILISLAFTKKGHALEIALVQGFAFHYTESPDYNDSVFKDNLTSTNTLLNISQGNYTLTVLADSQGDLSTAFTYSHNLFYRPNQNLNAVMGVYNLRSDKMLEDSIVTMFPAVNIGDRSFSITPLVGLEYQYKLNETISLDALITPAFTLFGVKLVLF